MDFGTAENLCLLSNRQPSFFILLCDKLIALSASDSRMLIALSYVA